MQSDPNRQFVTVSRKRSHRWVLITVVTVALLAAVGIALWITTPLWLNEVTSMFSGTGGDFSLDVHVLDSSDQPLPGAFVGVPSTRRWYAAGEAGEASVRIPGSGIYIIIYNEGFSPALVKITDDILSAGSPIAVNLEPLAAGSLPAAVYTANQTVTADKPASPLDEPLPAEHPVDHQNDDKKHRITPRAEVETFHERYVAAYNNRDLETYIDSYSRKAFGEKKWREMKADFEREFTVAGKLKMVIEKRSIGANKNAARIDWIFHLEGTTAAGGVISAGMSRAKRSDFLHNEKGTWRIIKTEDR